MLTSQGDPLKKETRERDEETILIEFVESLRIQEEITIQEEAKQIKLHNHRNAKRRIQHKKFLESKKKEV